VTEDPVPDTWFADPSLSPRSAERIRRRVVAAARPPSTLIPEASLATLGSALLLAWALHAVLPA
jgi:hypothetical protein